MPSSGFAIPQSFGPLPPSNMPGPPWRAVPCTWIAGPGTPALVTAATWLRTSMPPKIFNGVAPVYNSWPSVLAISPAFQPDMAPENGNPPDVFFHVRATSVIGSLAGFRGRR